MNIFASVLHTAYKLSGAKKAFGLPEDELKGSSVSRTAAAALLCPPITRRIIMIFAIHPSAAFSGSLPKSAIIS